MYGFRYLIKFLKQEMLSFINVQIRGVMDRVIAAQVYLRICELEVLAPRAGAGMSRPMVSRYLEQMESWAGARLIHRSTRRLTLTPAGRRYCSRPAV